MSPDWEALLAAGVPLGAARPRPAPPLDAGRIRAALEAIARDLALCDEPMRAALVAWLRAWRQHWPTSFDALGAAARELCDRLSAEDLDQNRYLKLRRIAVENLAGLL